ncbi:MAG: hypothetical protein U9Q91_06035, partial [Candidatus Marinimicrobia bacterium]|nr:hypothetical protein [Candidatus Neomarinimicrobiota bacterium]
MKFPRLIFPILLILLALSACSTPPEEEEEFTTEINVLGLYPDGNDNYSILATKSVRNNNMWEYYDSLMFISIDTSGNEMASHGVSYENPPYIRNQYLLDDG